MIGANADANDFYARAVERSLNIGDLKWDIGTLSAASTDL